MHAALKPSITYPDSWYAATLGDVVVRSNCSSDLQCDVAIIGAGLAGLSTALELARRGSRVVVVEAGRIAWGASGRNGGLVTPGFAVGYDSIKRRCGEQIARRLYSYSQLGLNLVRSNVSSIAEDCLMGNGKYSVSRYPDTAGMEEEADFLSRECGEPVSLHDRQSLKAVMDTDRYFDGIYKPHGFHIHPLRYAHRIAEELERLGGIIFEASPALKIEKGDGYHTVVCEQGLVSAENLVVCTSGYDQGFYRPVSRSVLPVATHVAVTEPLTMEHSTVLDTNAAVADTGNACDYYRKIDDGRLLWGGKITTLRAPPGSLDQLMHAAIVDVYPSLASVGIEFSWSGLMGYCRHKMPVIRQQEPGIWVATAFGGHGLNTTAMAGNLVSSAIVEGDRRWQDFDRFGLSWNGGWFGQWAVQTSYFWMQLKDTIREKQADRT